MNEENGFIIAIGQSWRDRTAVAVYADWLEEHTGRNRFAALKRAAQCARNIRNQVELTAACYWLRTSSWERDEIEHVLRSSSPFGDTWPMLVVALPGRREPRYVDTSMFSDGEWLNGFTVYVGARNLIELINETRLEIRSRYDAEENDF